MKTILALDPAHSTGYAVAKIYGQHCEIVEYGFIDVDSTSVYIGDWCLDLQKRISSIQDRVEADEISVEDYFFGSRFASGSNLNPAYRASIHMWARQRGYTMRC